MRARQRPGAAARTGDRLKLHRHAVRLGGERYTVITLRPGTRAGFSGNYYHETWHVLSDLHGAWLLGRLLWGLAYQRVPRTLILIDRPLPSPFSAAASDPVALVPALLTPLSARAARELRTRLPLGAPQGTVRWHTPGLIPAVTADRAWRPHDRGYRIGRRGGLLVFAATPPVLRDWAVEVYRLGEHLWQGMDYAELGLADGEVQVFTDYQRRVSAARVARREILASLPGPLPEADLDPLIWERAASVRARALPHGGLARPVAVGGLGGGEFLRRAEPGRHRRRRTGQDLVVLDVQQPQPALLAHRQGDEAAELHELRLGEMPVQPLPERVVGVEPPGDRLRVGQGRLLAFAEPGRALEIEQVVVLPLGQALRPGLLRALVPAVLALDRARDVHPAQFLDGVIAYPVAEDRLPGPGEGPEAGGHVRAHGRTLRPRRALPPAPVHLGPHLVVHRLERQVADPLLVTHQDSLEPASHGYRAVSLAA